MVSRQNLLPRGQVGGQILFCVFVVVGAAAQLNSVLNFSDAMIFAMMVPNMVGLVLLFPQVREELTKYLKTVKLFESNA